MEVNTIIHEQIDWNGSIKSFQIKEREEYGDMWVAFPGDYDGRRDGPYYFLDQEYKTWFQDKTASCRQLKIAAVNFYEEGKDFVFKTEWHRIPTDRNQLTYYSLYMPEFAVPTEIHFWDPYRAGAEYGRSVHRDDEKNRYVLYLECSSRFGLFSFQLMVKFHKDEANFMQSSYNDDYLKDFYEPYAIENYMSTEDDRKAINNFFIQAEHYNQDMGDTYNVNQAGAVGPNASANNITFTQTNSSLPANFDYDLMSKQIDELRSHIAALAKTGEQWQAVTALTSAEAAAKEKDGNKVLSTLSTAGKWLFDAAKDIGLHLAADVIAKAIGIS